MQKLELITLLMTNQQYNTLFDALESNKDDNPEVADLIEYLGTIAHYQEIEK